MLRLSLSRCINVPLSLFLNLLEPPGFFIFDHGLRFHHFWNTSDLRGIQVHLLVIDRLDNFVVSRSLEHVEP